MLKLILLILVTAVCITLVITPAVLFIALAVRKPNKRKQRKLDKIIEHWHRGNT